MKLAFFIKSSVGSSSVGSHQYVALQLSLIWGTPPHLHHSVPTALYILNCQILNVFKFSPTDNFFPSFFSVFPLISMVTILYDVYCVLSVSLLRTRYFLNFLFSTTDCIALPRPSSYFQNLPFAPHFKRINVSILWYSCSRDFTYE